MLFDVVAVLGFEEVDFKSETLSLCAAYARITNVLF